MNAVCKKTRKIVNRAIALSRPAAGAQHALRARRGLRCARTGRQHICSHTAAAASSSASPIRATSSCSLQNHDDDDPSFLPTDHDDLGSDDSRSSTEVRRQQATQRAQQQQSKYTFKLYTNLLYEYVLYTK